MSYTISEDEIRALKEYVVLLMLTKVLDKDRAVIEAAPFKIREPWAKLAEAAHEAAVRDIIQARQELRRRGFKIHGEGCEGKKYIIHYKLRGYEHKDAFWGEHLRSEAQIRMERYLNVNSGK